MAEAAYWTNSEAHGFQIVRIRSENDGICEVELSSSTLSQKDAPVRCRPILKRSRPRPNRFVSLQKIFTAKRTDLHATPDGIDELVYLKYFSTPAVVNSLSWRFQNDLIYVRIAILT